MTSCKSFQAIPGSSLPLFLAAALVLSFPALAQEPKAGPSGSALESLSGDTTLVIRLRSASDLARKYKASPFYALRDHPDIKKFIDEIEKKLEEGVSDARTKLGFDPRELLDMIQGECLLSVGGLDRIAAALAAEFSGGEADLKPGDLPLILVLDAGASAPKLRENFGKFYEFAQKEGAQKTVDDFRGGKITTLTQGKDAEKKEKEAESGLDKVFFGELGSRFLVSVSRPYMEQTMANLTAPPADGLTKSPDFAATLKEIRPDSDFLFFLNVKPIAAAARKNLQANPMASMVWGLVEGKVLGRGLRNVGISGSLRENDFQQIAFINNGGASEGIFGIFKGQPFGSKPSSLIPDDVDQLTSTSINAVALYTMVKDLYAMAAPFMAMAGGGAGGPGGPGDFDQTVKGMFQVEPKQVADSMGNMFHLFQKGGASPDNPLGNITVALELKDEMPIKELLSKILMSSGIQPQKYLDRDFYPLSPGGDENGPALALADKYLVLGVKGDSVKEVIRRSGKGGKGLGDTPDYQALAGKIPSQIYALSYSGAKAFRDQLKMIKDIFSTGIKDGPAPDLTILGDVVTGSIGYGIWKDQGYYSESIVAFKKGAPKTGTGSAEK